MDILNYKIVTPFEAVYTERKIGIYKNNPYIEALPPMLDRPDVIKMIASFPDYDKEERMLGVTERKLMVQTLFDFYYPIDRSLEMYEKITALLCTGYSARNPFKKEFYQQTKYVKNAANYPYQTQRIKQSSASNNGLAVVGISGIGKTSAIEQVLSLYPQCIVHKQYKEYKCSFLQLVYLKLECPYDGSIKALCKQFFYELTMLFGENSYSYHLRGDMVTKEYLEKMKLVVHQLGLGMLIIDEVQNLREAKGKEREQMLNFFVSLRNELNIPVILVGTPKTYPILQGDFRNTRRGIGQGGIEWGVLEKDNPFLKKLVRGMWRYQWTNVETPLTQEIEDVLYDECQGITDILIKIYMMVQLRAMDKKDETITPELIRKTAKKDFALIQPMIEAIRKNDLEAFGRFEDIRPANMENLIQQHILESSKNQEVILHRRMLKDLQKQQQKTFKEELFNKLFELGYPKTRIKAAVKITLNELENDLDIEKGVVIAKGYIETTYASKKKRNISQDDLRNAPDNNLDVYEEIKQKGHITDVNNELGIEGK